LGWARSASCGGCRSPHLARAGRGHRSPHRLRPSGEVILVGVERPDPLAVRTLLRARTASRVAPPDTIETAHQIGLGQLDEHRVLLGSGWPGARARPIRSRHRGGDDRSSRTMSGFTATRRRVRIEAWVQLATSRVAPVSTTGVRAARVPARRLGLVATAERPPDSDPVAATEDGELGLDRILTVPNVVTLLRLLCIPLFLWLLFGAHRQSAAASCWPCSGPPTGWMASWPSLSSGVDARQGN